MTSLGALGTTKQEQVTWQIYKPTLSPKAGKKRKEKKKSNSPEISNNKLLLFPSFAYSPNMTLILEDSTYFSHYSPISSL